MVETRTLGSGMLSLVGLIGGEWFGRAAGDALASATVITGTTRHLESLPQMFPGSRRTAPRSVSNWLESIESWVAEGEKVCAVASGDPGFFGFGRIAAARFRDRLRVFPAASSVSLAFARAGLSWDDAVVVSAHGRPLEHAVKTVSDHSKVAVLCSPDNPPQALAEALAAGGCPPRNVFVASRIGERDESWWRGDLRTFLHGSFDGLSVVLTCSPEPSPDAPGVLWGLPEEKFDHRSGMITKAEVRAVALGKLGIAAAGVMWDVGAGSGSVAFECSELSPGLRIFAIERRPDDFERMRDNLATTSVEAILGEAPAVLASLPDPERVFLGGGGAAVLDEAIKRLRPNGRIVGTFASFGRAAYAAERLGNVIQVSVGRGVRSGPDASFRLEAENPVFVCWGPA